MYILITAAMATSSTAPLLPLFLTTVLILVTPQGASSSEYAGGSWEILLENAGIASMHTAVTHYNTVVMLDRTNIGPSFLRFPDEADCRNNPDDHFLTHDCTAHSALFTPGLGNSSSSIRPLSVFTDTWCSSGQFMPDGSLLQTGGDYDGFTVVRSFSPCRLPSAASGDGDGDGDGDPAPARLPCDWIELSNVSLQDGRWYATNQLLPSGAQIVVGGRGVFTHEFIPNPTDAPKASLPFLEASQDSQSDVMYPFVHLLPDGNLYIFANRDSVVYDYSDGAVVKTLPTIPGEPRNYPSAGSSVMLPLMASAIDQDVEILICGGAQLWCNSDSLSHNASQTCGRINIRSQEPEWEMDTMPFRRAMGDMLYLPTGDILIINGAQNGCQGWGKADNPILHPVTYRPYEPMGSRFLVHNPSTIPRLYHSTANLLADGRVLIAGSNPHEYYNFTSEFPTELRVEAFIPDYMNGQLGKRNHRPVIVNAPEALSYGEEFTLNVSMDASIVLGNLEVTMISSPFTTHSYSQGLRCLKLPISVQAITQENIDSGSGGNYFVLVNGTAPISPTLAPPSYYMLFVNNQGIPSNGTWVQMTHSF